MNKIKGQIIIKEEIFENKKINNMYLNEEILHANTDVITKFISEVKSSGSKILHDIIYYVEVKKNEEGDIVGILYLHDNKNITKIKSTISQRLQEKKDLIHIELNKNDLSKITVLALNNLLEELEKFVLLNEQTLKIEEKIAKDKSTIKSNKAVINSFLSRNI